MNEKSNNMCKRQVRLHAVVHQHIVEHAVVVKLIGLFVGVLRAEPAPEEVLSLIHI